MNDQHWNGVGNIGRQYTRQISRSALEDCRLFDFDPPNWVAGLVAPRPFSSLPSVCLYMENISFKVKVGGPCGKSWAFVPMESIEVKKNDDTLLIPIHQGILVLSNCVQPRNAIPNSPFTVIEAGRAKARPLPLLYEDVICS